MWQDLPVLAHSWKEEGVQSYKRFGQEWALTSHTQQCTQTAQTLNVLWVNWVPIAPNFRGIIFLWISWFTPRSWIFYLRIFNFVGGGLFTSGACDALNIIPWMTLLAYFKKSNPSKAVLLSPTGPLSLQMPSFCIELVRRPTNAWQKSWREQATQRPSRPQN